MKAMMEWFCARRGCARTALRPRAPLTIEVDGLGQATVQPWDDPADVVEKFAYEAAEKNIAVGEATAISLGVTICEPQAAPRHGSAVALA